MGFVQSGDNTCLLGEKWFNRLVHSDCGNVICYSIGAYTGGLGDPRVSHAHLVRHTRWQPISDSVSRSTALLPGVLDGSRFNGTRLWNRSVFMIDVPIDDL